MKKSLLSILAGLAIIGTVSAQEDSRTIGTTTKKGANILPAAGDFAIGIDAVPFLGYAGNIFTNANNTAPSFDGKSGSIFGKYFLTDQTAVRARVDFGFGSDKTTTEVPSATDPSVNVKNTFTEKQNGLTLAVGYELRRGYGRLQGFYGGEVSLGFSNASESYTYGNSLTATNVGPRTLSEKFGKGTNFGVGGFAGVEYFIAPKISVGGELGAGIGFDSIKGGEKKTEEWDAVNSVVKTTTTDNSGNKNGEFNFGTTTQGRLTLTFHF